MGKTKSPPPVGGGLFARRCCALDCRSVRSAPRPYITALHVVGPVDGGSRRSSSAVTKRTGDRQQAIGPTWRAALQSDPPLAGTVPLKLAQPLGSAWAGASDKPRFPSWEVQQNLFCNYLIITDLDREVDYFKEKYVAVQQKFLDPSHGTSYLCCIATKRCIIPFRPAWSEYLRRQPALKYPTGFNGPLHSLES